MHSIYSLDINRSGADSITATTDGVLLLRYLKGEVGQALIRNIATEGAGRTDAIEIKEYLDVAVKNDDHLVKLTAITQRYISTTQTISGEASLLSDEEKKELLDMASKDFEEELSEEIEKIDAEEKILQEKINKAKNLVNGEQ